MIYLNDIQEKLSKIDDLDIATMLLDFYSSDFINTVYSHKKQDINALHNLALEVIQDNTDIFDKDSVNQFLTWINSEGKYHI